jgi:MinD-like ATPase involved in chromosome partitioning or flagellar assembly/ActR/RegA family two-component response regulator
MDNGPTKILLIEDNPADARLIQETLSGVNGAGMDLWWADRLSTGLERLAEGEVSVVLLDLTLPDSQGLDTLAKLRAQAPDVPVIVVTGLDDEDLAMQAARDGAQDYVTKSSVNPRAMARLIRFTIERHRSLAGRLTASEDTPIGRVLGFIGAKGGVGATTVALNVAAVLARQGKRVIALELRSCFGAFSFQFRRTPNGGLGDLLELDAADINERALHQRLVTLACGAKALFGAQTADGFREIQPQQAEAIIKAAAQMADYVIVDLPSQPCGANQSAIAVCNFTVLVVEREPGAVAAGRSMAELLRSWIPDKTALGAVLITKDALAACLSTSAVHAELGCPIAGVVPPAAELCATSYRLGIPLALSDPDSLAAGSLTDLANKLAEPVLVPVSV